MYQFAIFRRLGFLEIAASTKQFPRIAVMLIKMNIVDSVAIDKTVRSDMADGNVICADILSVGEVCLEFLIKVSQEESKILK